MHSPARTTSSDDEDTNNLAKLKAKYKAKVWEVEEKKVRKERERHEQREKEEREEMEHIQLRRLGDRERRVEEQVHLGEETEVVMGPLRRAWKAAATKALEMKEAKSQAEAERDRAAFRNWQNGGAYNAAGSEAEEGEVVAEPSSSEAEEDIPAQKSPRRRVVESRQNTAEVVIVRPAATVKQGLGEVAGTEQVSTPDLSRQSVSDTESGALLSNPLREVPVPGGTVCPFAGSWFHVHSVSGAQGAMQPDPRTHEEKDR